MAEPLSETTIYWNGTTVEQTVGDVTRTRVGLLSFDGGEVTTPEAEMYGGVRIQTGDPVQGASGALLQLLGTYSGSSSDGAVRQRAMADDWLALGTRYNPHASAGALLELRVDRKDTSNATTSRVALARVSHAPTLTVVKGGDESMGVRAAAFYRYAVPFRIPGGLWRDRTATTGTGTVNGSTNPVTLNNTGVKGTTVRVEWATVVGTVTGISISDSTGVLFTLTHATGFAAADYVDFGYTTDGQLAVSSNTTVNVGGWWELATGSASYDVARTAGTGTGTLTISWRPHYFSF